LSNNHYKLYDEDYFERGIQTGKSCYENYRWIPELTIPMAMTMIDLLEIRRWQDILDFGCAKGFLVKAFRMLYRNSWGVDASNYAISNVDPMVKDFCFRIYEVDQLPDSFDFCIAKDVFEHLDESDLIKTLEGIKASQLFVVVPLGEGGSFRVPAYERDITHKIREPEGWWINAFMRCGWDIDYWSFHIEGIKDNWSHYPNGNGFFILKKCYHKTQYLLLYQIHLALRFSIFLQVFYSHLLIFHLSF